MTEKLTELREGYQKTLAETDKNIRQLSTALAQAENKREQLKGAIVGLNTLEAAMKPKDDPKKDDKAKTQKLSKKADADQLEKSESKETDADTATATAAVTKEAANGQG